MPAIEAIDGFKNGIMSGMKVFVQRLWRLISPTLELLLNCLAILGRPKQLKVQFRFQWGSWNRESETNAVSVRVCKKAIRRCFWTALSIKPPELYFINGSMVVEGSPPEL